MRTIYFDYNATTPLDLRAREAMLPFLGAIFGNPSSVHHVGRQARALLDELRDRTAQAFHCKPSEVVFTSGGTESNNMAIFGTARLLRDKGRHLITSTIEHDAALHAFDYLESREGFEVTRLPVDSLGRIDPANLMASIRHDTVLVSVQAVNNEIGTIQPIAELGRLCRARGVIFHTDAVQWFGKLSFTDIHQFQADLVSVCAHKFHGPKGAGALFIRSPLQPDPILFGGGHENERRAGTENVAAIAGMVESLQQCVLTPCFDSTHLRPLSERLVRAVEELELRGVVLRSPQEAVLSNTVSFTVEGTDSMNLLAALDLEGICASSGSACSAGSIEPSHVILALGAGAAAASALVRFSLGRENTLAEVEEVCGLLPQLLHRAQTA